LNDLDVRRVDHAKIALITNVALKLGPVEDPVYLRPAARQDPVVLVIVRVTHEERVSSSVWICDQHD